MYLTGGRPNASRRYGGRRQRTGRSNNCTCAGILGNSVSHSFVPHCGMGRAVFPQSSSLVGDNPCGAGDRVHVSIAPCIPRESSFTGISNGQLHRSDAGTFLADVDRPDCYFRRWMVLIGTTIPVETASAETSTVAFLGVISTVRLAGLYEPPRPGGVWKGTQKRHSDCRCVQYPSFAKPAFKLSDFDRWAYLGCSLSTSGKSLRSGCVSYGRIDQPGDGVAAEYHQRFARRLQVFWLVGYDV